MMQTKKDWRYADKMDKLKIKDEANDILAELNTIIVALGNKDVFVDSTQDISISLFKVREQIKELCKEMEE